MPGDSFATRSGRILRRVGWDWVVVLSLLGAVSLWPDWRGALFYVAVIVVLAVAGTAGIQGGDA